MPVWAPRGTKMSEQWGRFANRPYRRDTLHGPRHRHYRGDPEVARRGHGEPHPKGLRWLRRWHSGASGAVHLHSVGGKEQGDGEGGSDQVAGSTTGP